MMKYYEVIIDECGELKREHVCAHNELCVEGMFKDDQEIIRIQEGEWPLYVDVVINTLRNNGFGDVEIEIIEKTLLLNYVNALG